MTDSASWPSSAWTRCPAAPGAWRKEACRSLWGIWGGCLVTAKPQTPSSFGGGSRQSYCGFERSTTDRDHEKVVPDPRFHTPKIPTFAPAAHGPIQDSQPNGDAPCMRLRDRSLLGEGCAGGGSCGVRSCDGRAMLGAYCFSCLWFVKIGASSCHVQRSTGGVRSISRCSESNLLHTAT